MLYTYAYVCHFKNPRNKLLNFMKLDRKVITLQLTLDFTSQSCKVAAAPISHSEISLCQERCPCQQRKITKIYGDSGT